jgi:ribosomal protein L11 methyltransferase
MNPGPLWKVSVLTTEAAEEAVAELLSTRLGAPASSYTDLKTGKTTVTVYLNRKPALSEETQAQLIGALKELQRGEGRRGRVTLKLSWLGQRDWANSWRRHFKPLEIGRRLLIRPSWSRRKPKRGQMVVTLDPGMSFGTGQHPTTAFCLHELVGLRDEGIQQSLIDIGTGSGILAICAAKLGYGPVHALDVDPISIQIARANARKNGVGRKVQFKCGDFTKMGPRPARQYSVVCANLIANLLLAQKDRLAALVREGGRLVVAGILKEEFGEIQTAFIGAGLRMERSRAEGEWRSGTFEGKADCELQNGC